MFEIYEGNAPRLDQPRLWYWRYRAKNGEVIADGAEGYASAANAFRAARRFKFLAPFARVQQP